MGGGCENGVKKEWESCGERKKSDGKMVSFGWLEKGLKGCKEWKDGICEEKVGE